MIWIPEKRIQSTSIFSSLGRYIEALKSSSSFRICAVVSCKQIAHLIMDYMQSHQNAHRGFKFEL